MRSLLFCAIIALLAAFCLASPISTAIAGPSPLLVWTNQPDTSISAESIDDAFHSLFAKENEAILAISLSKTSLDELSLFADGLRDNKHLAPFLNKLSALNEMVSPYVFSALTPSAHLFRAIRSAVPDATVFRAHKGSFSDRASYLGGEINRLPQILSNGVTDLYYIELNNLDDLADEKMVSMIGSLDKLSNGKFAVALFADNSDEIDMAFPSGDVENQHRVFHRLYSIGSIAASAGSNVTNRTAVGPQYITSNIVIGLLVGFFLLSVFMFGASWALEIQTPLRFPNKKVGVNKEY